MSKHQDSQATEPREPSWFAWAWRLFGKSSLIGSLIDAKEWHFDKLVGDKAELEASKYLKIHLAERINAKEADIYEVFAILSCGQAFLDKNQ
jgi:hypothetical protein